VGEVWLQCVGHKRHIRTQPPRLPFPCCTTELLLLLLLTATTSNTGITNGTAKLLLLPPPQFEPYRCNDRVGRQRSGCMIRVLS